MGVGKGREPSGNISVCQITRGGSPCSGPSRRGMLAQRQQGWPKDSNLEQVAPFFPLSSLESRSITWLSSEFFMNTLMASLLLLLLVPPYSLGESLSLSLAPAQLPGAPQQVPGQHRNCNCHWLPSPLPSPSRKPQENSGWNKSHSPKYCSFKKLESWVEEFGAIISTKHYKKEMPLIILDGCIFVWDNSSFLLRVPSHKKYLIKILPQVIPSNPAEHCWNPLGLVKSGLTGKTKTAFLDHFYGCSLLSASGLSYRRERTCTNIYLLGLCGGSMAKGVVWRL